MKLGWVGLGMLNDVETGRCDVVSSPSPTHPSFIVTASCKSAGQLEVDAYDLYRVMGMIADELKREIGISDYYVGGYSLGGTTPPMSATSMHRRSASTSRRRWSSIHRSTCINSVSPRHHGRQASALRSGSGRPFPRPHLRSGDRALQRQGQIDFTDNAFLYRAYTVLEPPEQELELLIGRDLPADVERHGFHQRRHDQLPPFVPKNAQLTATTSLTDVMIQGMRLNFVNYFDGVYVPFMQRRSRASAASCWSSRRACTPSSATCAPTRASCCSAPRTTSSCRAPRWLARGRIRRPGAHLPDRRPLRQHGPARVRADHAGADRGAGGAVLSLRALAALTLAGTLGACAATPAYSWARRRRASS